jgi:hypothetical protein
MHAMFRGKGLTRNVTVPVSAGLLVNLEDYFEALTSYRDGDPEPIVQQVSTASYAAIQNGRRLVEDLRAVQLDWRERVRARRDAGAWRIADLLVRHSVINAGFVSDELGIARRTSTGASSRWWPQTF